MGIKIKNKKTYTAPKWEQKNDSYYSYFNQSKALQVSKQSEILKKSGRTAKLPINLAYETHAHSDQFFNEVGNTFKTDCKISCSYCCHQPATVFPFEAIQIAKVLKAELSKEQLELMKVKMQARVRDFVGNSVRKNVNNKTACPLLSNDQCSIYKNRPLTCRMAHSFSVKSCTQALHQDRAKVEIPVSLELVSAVSGMIEGTFEKLPEEKLDGHLYELCSAVLMALSKPDIAKVWAKGDLSAFQDCIRDDT